MALESTDKPDSASKAHFQPEPTKGRSKASWRTQKGSRPSRGDSITATASNAPPVAKQQAHEATEPAQQHQPTGQQDAAQDAGNADSNAAPTPSQEQPQSQQSHKLATGIDAGNVPDPTAAGGLDSTEARTCVRERLQKHSEWPRILATVREMRGSVELASMKTEARERFIWGEMDRLYPKAQPIALLNEALKPSVDNELSAVEKAPIPRNSGDRISGLGDIPPTWPPLPANAALPAELGWVQANRLYVVEELASGGTRVHLDRAHEAAPSRSAIGWLETSIRSYAKFVEVAAKVTGAGDDEGEHMKRERMAIDEIRGLLAEMAGNPTGPGR